MPETVEQTSLVLRMSVILLPVLLFLAVGGVGVYLMLPRGQTRRQAGPRIGGGLLAVVSVALLSLMPLPVDLKQQITEHVLRPLPEGTSCTVFHGLAFVSVAAAVMMITSRNPVYSALWFALVLLSNSALYLLQRAEFLAAATVIVYAGAIIVTFLFVIMLAQPMGTASYDRLSREPLLACITGTLLSGALVASMFYAVNVEIQIAEPGDKLGGPPAWASNKLVQDQLVRSFESRDVSLRGPAATSWRLHGDQGEKPHVLGLGQTLFLEHYVSIEVIGMLLLAAVAGAVLIATQPEAGKVTGG